MLDTVKINHVQHISFTQSRLTDAVSVILSELLSYEHPSNAEGCFCGRAPNGNSLAGGIGNRRSDLILRCWIFANFRDGQYRSPQSI